MLVAIDTWNCVAKVNMRLLLSILLCGCMQHAAGQDVGGPDSLLAMSNKLTGKYINSVSEKSAAISGALDKQTDKYLAKLQKQEARLQKRLSKIDSSAAMKIFADAPQQYQQIQEKIKGKSTALLTRTHQYLPWLDSSGTSLRFLQNNPVTAKLNGGAAKISGALTQVKQLQDEFKKAANVKEFIQQRKEYLKQRLQEYDLGADLKKYNQTAYYYSQQVNEYRRALDDPDKAEQKALQILNKLPAFQKFMSKNSMLAALFAVPGNDDPSAMVSTVALQGLQTRASVQGLIQGQLSAGGPDAQSMFQANMDEAQAALNSLRSRLQQFESGGSGGSLGSSADLDMPGFEPNPQKTKTFWKRLQFGTDMQSVKSNAYFPTTTDVAFSVGYKLNAKNVIGIGASYKIGWGRDIKHISISSQGIGIRSFIDIKLKGSFYASGGLEYNYQQPFDAFRHLPGLSNWQKSGLIGVSKVISVKSKFFKQTKLQLLWDFLSYNQRPQSQALKFRIGYDF